MILCYAIGSTGTSSDLVTYMTIAVSALLGMLFVCEPTVHMVKVGTIGHPAIAYW